MQKEHCLALTIKVDSCKLLLSCYCFSLLEYHLVQKKAQCAFGKEENKGRVSLEACAEVCYGKSENFIFGTNEFRQSRCSFDNCDCFCEFGTENYKCKEIKEHEGFNLYAFRGKYLEDLKKDNIIIIT